MNIQHAQRIREVFDTVIDLDPAAREAMLDQECGSDLAMRREIESLLRIDRREQLAIDRAMAEPLAEGSGLPPSALPERIGRYRVTGLLGTGGMGIVYRARQEQPLRDVALKTLRPGLATRRILARFNNEIATLGRLRHEHIAQIYDAGKAQTAWGEQPYISMELVEGRPLLAFAERYDLDLRARLELFLQLCDGVQFAHQQGVIHRDLKPANILVRDDPDAIDAASRPARSPRPRGQVKILDFGVSRLIDHDPTAQPSLATLSGELIGTIAYMSPEQLECAPSAVDTRSDVYGLGAILFELISGRPPIDVRGHTVASVMRVLCAPPPALRECILNRPALARTVRGDLETIVAKALAREKSRRYASAAALADDVQRYLNGEPIMARRASLWYVGWKFANRHRGLVASSIIAAVLLAAGVGGTLWGLLRANAAAHDKHRLLETAIETVSRIAAEVVPPLNDVSGTAEARRALLEQLQRANATIRELAGDGARLWACQADLLTAISVLERTDGGLHDALAHRLEALAARRMALEAAPADVHQRRQLAMNTVVVGDCYKEQNEREAAERYYRDALRIQETFRAEGVEAAWLIDDLIYSEIRLAENAIAMFRPSEAEPRLRRALVLCDRLVSLDARREHVLNARQEILGQYGVLENARGRLARSAEYSELRLGLLRELVKLAPNNVIYANAMARVLINNVSSLACEEECADATRLIDEAVPICRRLRDENHREVEYLDVQMRIAAAQAKVAMLDGRPEDVIPKVRACFDFGLEHGLRADGNREPIKGMYREFIDLCRYAAECGYRHLADRIRHEFIIAFERKPLEGPAGATTDDWVWKVMTQIAGE